MNRKITICNFVKLITCIIVACILTYSFGMGTLFDKQKYKINEYSSINNFEIVNAELLNENTIRSKNIDPQIILKEINAYISDVSIEIESTSQKDFIIQVFYDTGQGFNELEASSIWGKSGTNLVHLNCSKQVKNLRIDPTTLADQQITIRKITLNQQHSLRDLSLILILNMAVLFFITLFFLKGTKTYNCITFVLFTAILYFIDYFWLVINAPPVINILFFIILCMVLVLLPLVWKELEKNA